MGPQRRAAAQTVGWLLLLLTIVAPLDCRLAGRGQLGATVGLRGDKRAKTSDPRLVNTIDSNTTPTTTTTTTITTNNNNNHNLADRHHHQDDDDYGDQDDDDNSRENRLQSLHRSLEEADEAQSQATQVNESGQPNHSTQPDSLPQRKRPAANNNSSASPSPTASIKRLLVSQLSNLIMNNGPQQIVDQLRGTKVSGQILSETAGVREPPASGAAAADDDLGSGAGSSNFVDDDYETDAEIQSSIRLTDAIVGASRAKLNMSAPEGLAREGQVLRLPVAQALEYTPPAMPQQLPADEQQPPVTDADQQAASQPPPPTSLDEQTVTCSPDYEDQSMLEAASGGNLTAEQQQQLLAGADQAGFLPANDSLGQHRQQLGPCVQPGSQMIETITKVIAPILFSVIIVVGLLGNIIVMLVILEDRKTERELTPTNLLILDLSLADLSFIVFCIPFTGWDYAVGHWVFGPLWCQFNQYLIVVCALSSIYTLVLMSIDRFMAIVYPLECISYRTSQNMLKAIYIKWIVILLIALPTWTMHGLIDSPLGPDQYNCRFLADQYNPLHFQIIFFITSYLFPLILIFCLYLRLLNKLWFGSKPHGHKESLKMLESKKKVTWLVAGIVVVFALCWCPIQVMLILMRLKSHKITATYVAIQVFAHTLGYMNSCINPIVYAFASETFHQSFKRSWLGRFIRWLFHLDQVSLVNLQ